MRSNFARLTMASAVLAVLVPATLLVQPADSLSRTIHIAND